MRHITTLVLTIVLVSFATIAYAQKSEGNSKIPDVRQTIVTFQIKSVIGLTDSNSTKLPSVLISYFNDQTSLAKLQVNMTTKRNIARINASYVFSDLESYQQWRKKNKTKKFIQFLQDNNKRQNLFMKPTVNKVPLDALVEHNQQD